MGVVLAGGRGRRLGGEKACAPMSGQPLIAYALRALQEVVGDVAVVAKPESKLPRLPGVAVWREPGQPRHPAFGILEGLRQAAGRPTLVCAVDLPLVTPDLLSGLLRHSRSASAPAVVAGVAGRLQPLLGIYRRQAEPRLRAELERDPRMPLRRAVLALAPEVHEVAAPEQLLNVNTSADLARAEVLLQRRRRPPPVI